MRWLGTQVRMIDVQREANEQLKYSVQSNQRPIQSQLEKPASNARNGDDVELSLVKMGEVEMSGGRESSSTDWAINDGNHVTARIGISISGICFLYPADTFSGLESRCKSMRCYSFCLRYMNYDEVLRVTNPSTFLPLPS